MTNCRSYYRFLLLCVIGLIVGGALNTHVELELELLRWAGGVPLRLLAFFLPPDIQKLVVKKISSDLKCQYFHFNAKRIKWTR